MLLFRRFEVQDAKIEKGRGRGYVSFSTEENMITALDNPPVRNAHGR